MQSFEEQLEARERQFGRPWYIQTISFSNNYVHFDLSFSHAN